MSSRHRSLSFALAMLVLLVASMTVPSPGVHAAGYPSDSSTHATMPAIVKTAPAQILHTTQGRTLYVYTLDKPDKSVCSGVCAKYWPPLLLPPGSTAPLTTTGAIATFGVAPRSGNARQLTFDGAPLYTFLKDKDAGDAYGQGVEGTWWTIVVAGGKAGAATTAINPAASWVQALPSHMLVTGNGRSLYVFAPDTHNKSTCYGPCAKYWPPLLLPAGMQPPATMPGVAGKFGVALRTGGTRQLTYDGAPLYTWLKDKKPGDITGQGVAGTWWVAAV